MKTKRLLGNVTCASLGAEFSNGFLNRLQGGMDYNCQQSGLDRTGYLMSSMIHIAGWLLFASSFIRSPVTCVIFTDVEWYIHPRVHVEAWVAERVRIKFSREVLEIYYAGYIPLKGIYPDKQDGWYVSYSNSRCILLDYRHIGYIRILVFFFPSPAHSCASHASCRMMNTSMNKFSHCHHVNCNSTAQPPEPLAANRTMHHTSIMRDRVTQSLTLRRALGAHPSL